MVITNKIIDEIREGNSDQKICFVCRNNGQTLKLSSVFRKRGIVHTANVSTTEKNYAAWISEIFFDYSGKYIKCDEFIDRYNFHVIEKISLAPQEIWEKITGMDDTIYISDFLKDIGSSKKDDVYFRCVTENNVLVSNIHKTKGREYDHVIVDQEFIHSLMRQKKEIGEYKTLYVALTRPKQSLFSAPLSETRKGQKLEKLEIFKTQRFRFGKVKDDRVINFELKSDDIDPISFLSDEIQPYIKNISVGDSIELKKTNENGQIVYRIFHSFEDRQMQIGQLEDTFRDDLMARMNLTKDDYVELPSTITDLYVSGKFTHISTENYLESNPEIKRLSPNGIWQWLEFMGIGHALYDTY